jgi:hypothetical protein|tara:strand:- start:298 stop:510 length:213 start_codon:yes stop_codon:yes gene_type:complete
MDVADFAKHVYKLLHQREEQLALMMTSGGVQNFEQYQRLVGEVQGLVYAKEEIKTLLERSTDDVEDFIRS